MSGRHAKEKGRSRAATGLAVSAVALGGVAAPVLLAGSASAASVADWDKVAGCESGGDWSINHSSDGLSVGGLQFQNPSWHDALAYLNAHGYDTSGWTQNLYQGMPRSAVPSKAQTILAGEALLALQGPGAWVCNAIVGSPLQSSGPHGSMFRGGVDPTGGSAPAVDPAPPPVADPVPAPAYVPRHARRHHGGGSAYTVRPGDCLSGIAARHGIPDWHDLYGKNRDVVGDNPDVIYPGQVLQL